MFYDNNHHNTYIDIYGYSAFDSTFDSAFGSFDFLLENLHSESHKIYLLNLFDSFNFVMILNAFKFIFSFLLVTNILTDRSSLQLPLHLYKLTLNG